MRVLYIAGIVAIRWACGFVFDDAARLENSITLFGVKGLLHGAPALDEKQLRGDVFFLEKCPLRSSVRIGTDHLSVLEEFLDGRPFVFERERRGEVACVGAHDLSWNRRANTRS